MTDKTEENKIESILTEQENGSNVVSEQKQELSPELKEIEELKKKLVEKEIEVEKYKDQGLRAIADLSNFTKKSKENMDEFIKYSNAEFIEKLLPIIDTFEIAIKSIKEHHNESKDKTNFKHFYSGIELIYKDLINLLKKEGLKHQNVVGEKFNPLFHEVVSTIEVEDNDDNTILEEIRRGYILNDKVLRPSMVKIAKKKQ